MECDIIYVPWSPDRPQDIDFNVWIKDNEEIYTSGKNPSIAGQLWMNILFNSSFRKYIAFRI